MTNYLRIYNNEFGNKIFRYHFPSITALVEYLRTAPVNREIFTRLASEVIETEEEKQHSYGLESKRHGFGEPLEDTLNHLIYGYSDTYSEYRAKSNVDRIHIETPIDYTRVKSVRSYVGNRVDINAYVNGIAKNMLKPVRTVPKTHITVNYNLAYPGVMTEAQITNCGMIAMILIKALEQNNFSVNLNSYVLQHNTFKDDRNKIDKSKPWEILYVTINLKDFDMPLNESKCIGPFMRVEFKTRAIFRLIETTALDKTWNENYGYIVKDDERDRIIKVRPGDITFDNPKEMGIKGNDLEADLEATINYLNLGDIITLRKRLH